MNRNLFPRLAGTRKKPLAILLLGALLLLTRPALARDIYVDGAYGYDGNSGSASQPYKNFYKANSLARPGDNIYLKPTITYSTLWISASGTASKPITISGTGDSPNLTKVSGFGYNFGIHVAASYLTLAKLDVTAPGVYSAIHVPQGEHHVVITRNRVHDAGANGISLVGNDYMTISYNTVWGNAHNTSNNVFNSGISVKSALDIDSYTGLKMRVNGNIVYANTNIPSRSGVLNSDGNGIIIDNNRRTEYDNIWYRGRTLVSNNVVFGNGGRGIHMYLADHISVNGNTVYSNNQDPYEGNYRPGEITGDYVSDISVYNNIVYSDGKGGINNGKNTGTHVPISFLYCYNGFGKIIIQNNLGYRPQNDPSNFLYVRGNTIPVYASQNYWGNPYFQHASLNASEADFRVERYSLAMNHGIDLYALAYDINGTPRDRPTTIGAYELSAP